MNLPRKSLLALAALALAPVVSGCAMSEQDRQDRNLAAHQTAMANMANADPYAEVWCYGPVHGDPMRTLGLGLVDPPRVVVVSSDLRVAGSCDELLAHPATWSCVDEDSCQVDSYVGTPASVNVPLTATEYVP